jgi:hypothetical protein
MNLLARDVPLRLIFRVLACLLMPEVYMYLAYPFDDEEK